MTTTQASGRVSLPGGFQVPARFTIRLHGRVRRTPVECQVAVEMLGGKAHVRALAFEVRDPKAKPLSAADLAGLNLTQVLDAAVQQAALEYTPREWVHDGSATDLPTFLGWVHDQADADSAAALSAARSARERRRITPDDLRRVYEIHDAEGIEGVMDKLKYSERNARRLLARARAARARGELA
jgi:hypothetical protein